MVFLRLGWDDFGASQGQVEDGVAVELFAAPLSTLFSLHFSLPSSCCFLLRCRTFVLLFFFFVFFSFFFLRFNFRFVGSFSVFFLLSCLFPTFSFLGFFFGFYRVSSVKGKRFEQAELGGISLIG